MKSNMFKMMVTVCLSAFVFAANAADKSNMTDEQYVQYKNTGGSINTILPIITVSYTLLHWFSKNNQFC